MAQQRFHGGDRKTQGAAREQCRTQESASVSSTAFGLKACRVVSARVVREPSRCDLAGSA
jgi:hypothetical protein